MTKPVIMVQRNNNVVASATTTSPIVWKKEDGPRRIEVGISVQSVENINTLKETVDIGLLLDVFWLPTTEEYDAFRATSSSSSTSTSTSSTYAPLLFDNKSRCLSWDFHGNFQTVNARNDDERQVRKEPKLKNIRGIMKWSAQLWTSSSFKQGFNLRLYPFDCEQTMLRFEMGNIQQMIYCACDSKAKDQLDDGRTRAMPLYGFELAGSYCRHDGHGCKLVQTGQFVCTIDPGLYVAREWILMNAMLTVSSIIPYALHPIDKIGERLTVILTLLLTQVAFMITIQGDLPKAPYMSILEIYVFSPILFNCTVLFETSIIKAVDSKLDRNWIPVDNVFAIIHILAVMLVHVVLGLYCYRKRKEGTIVWMPIIATTKMV